MHTNALNTVEIEWEPTPTWVVAARAEQRISAADTASKDTSIITLNGEQHRL